jgi:hypothetical protein
VGWVCTTLDDIMIEPTIYMNGKDVPLTEALKKITDEWVDDGNYCAQTVIDLRDALIFNEKLTSYSMKGNQALKTQVKTLEKELAPFKAKEFYKKYEDMITETVTISKEEYESLLEDRKWRIALKNAGVDNWEGYSFACELLNKGGKRKLKKQ